MPPAAKFLVIAGLVLVGAGLLWWLGGPRWFGWIGRLPGDIRIEGERGGFHFPVVTCLVISVVLTVLIPLIRRFFG